LVGDTDVEPSVSLPAWRVSDLVSQDELFGRFHGLV